MHIANSVVMQKFLAEFFNESDRCAPQISNCTLNGSLLLAFRLAQTQLVSIGGELRPVQDYRLVAALWSCCADCGYVTKVVMRSFVLGMVTIIFGSF